MILFYKLFIYLYYIGIWLAAFFNKKAKLWIEGRKNWASKLKKELPVDQDLLWIHCASLGEFEQGRPLIEALKKEGNYKILLTFFSPSGYEIRKNYEHADFVHYLPLDTAQNAKQFLDIVQPQKVVFVKYEIWYYFLKEVQNRQIPTILISAIFRENQFYFSWYGKAFLELIKGFTQIFVQDENSKKILAQKGIENSTVAGDTRIDRVIEIAQNAKSIPLLNAFVQSKNIMVIGSSWAKDEAILIPFIHKMENSNWQFILAPHEIDKAHIQAIERSLKVDYITYSKAKEDNLIGKKVIIIDNIGMLSQIYQYAKLAYIGGGFGAGIHNILEPAVFEIPVIFGPNYHKFSEARNLVASKGAFSISNASELEAVFQELENPEFYNQTKLENRLFMEKNKGATQKIFETTFNI